MMAYQAAAVAESETSLARMLAEQAIDAPPVAAVARTGLVGGSALGGTVADAVRAVWDSTTAAFDRMVATELQDAGRNATGIGTTIRPALQGHVRHLIPPSCARCTILAGRFYRWSDGFLRHDLCDCVMVPTNEEPAEDLVADPMQAFHAGQVRGLSQADTQAIEDGADIGRVVNVRLKSAGLKRAGRVLDRGGRPTPEAIYRLSSSREDALALLERHGYIR